MNWEGRTLSSPMTDNYRRAWASVTAAAHAAAAAAAGVLLVTFDTDASSAATGSRFWTKRYRDYTLVDFFDLRIAMVWEMRICRGNGKHGQQCAL